MIKKRDPISFVIFIFTVTVLFISPILPTLSSAQTENERTQIFVGASSNNFPPMNLLDKNENLIGFGRELTDAVMEAVSAKVTHIHSSNWVEVLKWLDSGKADFIHDTGYTKERDKFLDFTKSIIEMPEVIFVNPNQYDITGFHSLKGKKVACVNKHISHLYLQTFPEITCYVVKTPIEGLYELISGKVDAFIYPKQIVLYLAQNLRLTDKIKVTGDPLRILTWSMAVKKGNKEILTLLNEGIDKVKRTGEYDRIYNKWWGKKVLSGYTKRELNIIISITVGLSIVIVSLIFLLFYNYKLRFEKNRLKKEILDRKKAEEALLKNQLFLKKAQEIGQIGTWELDVKRDKLLWTDETYNIFGIPIGTELTYEIFLNCVHPDDREYVDTKWKASFNKKPYNIEHRLLVDGKVKWVREKAELEFNERDECIRETGYIQDITKRKHAEGALRRSEKKYRHLFQNAPAGICEIDFEKVRFTNVNEIMCKYTGYSEEEFLSMNPFDLLTEDSKNLYIGRLEKLSAGEEPFDTVEYNIITKDDQEICFLLSNDFIYKNGKTKGARIVAHEITELKKAEQEKIKAQTIIGEQKKLALVGQVAGKMAHDFNNILGIIMGNAELSLRDCKDAETKKTLELIFEQTIRGKNLTKNLVAFAKDQEPKQEFFRISEKIDLVLNLLTKDLEGIELIKKDKPGVPDLLADPGMIEHALINLIQNSIHATSINEDPRIIIRTYCLGENIYFEVEDNGCGIPKEYLKNIYEPSFTLKGLKDVTGSYEKNIKGTGYGMANVKKYIEQHKGNLSVESEFGSGTKFTISLPVIKKELTTQEKVELQKEKIHFDKYILLVEDEQSLSDVQYRVLTQEPCNHKVDSAYNGHIAIDLFDRNEYDFVSLDYILPGDINGMDVYTHIRKANKTIPILFISGNIEFLESIKDLKQNDANIDHLSKPCQNRNYVSSINKLLGKTSTDQ